MRWEREAAEDVGIRVASPEQRRKGDTEISLQGAIGYLFVRYLHLDYQTVARCKARKKVRKKSLTTPEEIKETLMTWLLTSYVCPL